MLKMRYFFKNILKIPTETQSNQAMVFEERASYKALPKPSFTTCLSNKDGGIT